MTAKAHPLSVAAHASARETLKQAWAIVFPGEDAPIAALQILGAQAIMESDYGRACYKKRVDGVVVETHCNTNNWGAIQGSTVDPESGKTGGFSMSDFDSLSGKNFVANYQLYSEPLWGAAHMVRLMARTYEFCREPLDAGDIDAFCTELYLGRQRGGTWESPAGYFGGFHVLKGKAGAARLAAAEANRDDRADGTEANARAIAEALGEPLLAQRGGPATDRGPFGLSEYGALDLCVAGGLAYTLFRAWKG